MNVKRILEWWEELRYPNYLNPESETLHELIQEDGNLKGKSPVEGEIEPFLGIPKRENSQQIRERLFNTMIVNQNIVDLNGKVLVADIPGKIRSIVSKMILNKTRYEGVSHKFPNPIRWYHIAMIHLMECNLSFNHYLGNGQPLSMKTTIVPKGRGPFKTWEEGAIDAITYQKLNLVQDWSIGNALEMWERYNGWGYVLYHPEVNSPYLWSGTNHYRVGKYTSDSKFDKNAVSTQIGIAPVFSKLLGVV